MSEQDRFDWSDGDDFESLADEPMEGFADFEDADEFDSMSGEMSEGEPEDMPGDAAAVTGETVAAEATTEAKAKSGQRSAGPRRGAKGISGFELGFLFSASTLVAAAGVGSASLLAVGVNPASLWQPAKLLAWENYLNLQDSPLNILALILLGVFALTLLCSRAVGKAANRANERTEAAEEMLDRLTKLRLENETAWQDNFFKTYQPASTFVAETLGAWRLQVARQKRLTGLEGEIHRLEKAVADRSRTDLTGRFDYPVVGTLADEMAQLLDQNETTSRQLEEVANKDKAVAADMIRLLQDARCWHNASAGNLGLQGAALDRLAGRLDEASGALASIPAANDAAAVFKAFKTELDRVNNAAGNGPESGAELGDLVDQSSKLAFQIAMEVARLGPRGERLVPMSQSFEDLTTELRTVADRTGKSAAKTNDAGLVRKLGELEAVVRASTGDWQQQVTQCGPAARQLAVNLSEIVKSYAPQAERLTHLGDDFASFTGASFDPDDLSAGNPDNPPAGILDIESQTPFANDEDMHNGGGIHQPADVDPFAVTPPKRVVESPADPSFSSSVGEPDADVFGRDLDHEQLPDLEIENSFAPPQSEPAAPADKVVDQDVYDLDDFGAAQVADEEPVRDLIDLGATPVAAEGEDEVHDLSEFSAAPVAGDSAASAVEPEEPVADLADFGAVALETAGDSGETVYDLDDLGGVALDPAVGQGETIYDLSDFGAVKLG